MIAFAVFAFASFTDLFDGYFARRLEQETEIWQVPGPAGRQVPGFRGFYYLLAEALSHFVSMILSPEQTVVWTGDIRHMIYSISGKKRENILYAALKPAQRKTHIRWEIEKFFAWWKRHLKVYHLIARSEYSLMVQILFGLIYCCRPILHRHLKPEK